MAGPVGKLRGCAASKDRRAIHQAVLKLINEERHFTQINERD
jgi:hypothetical protein